MNQFSRTAYDLLKENVDLNPIPTFSLHLDKILNGGLHLNSVTELVGASRTGKTQICLQMCVNVQFPKIFDGVSGSVLYIDTTAAFHPERIKDITLAVREHLLQVSEGQKKRLEALENFTIDNILNNIFVEYASSLIEFVTIVESLEIFFETKPNVLITNQMSNKMLTDSSHPKPALGNAFPSCINNRIQLKQMAAESCIFKANILKSTFTNESCYFKITKDGIRSEENPQ